MTTTNCAALAAAIALAAGLSPAQASEGHDHGESPASASVTEARPRFTASTEAFELVGVLEGRQLTLYLDRSDTNEPIHQARIDIDIGGQTVQAQASADGTFQARLSSDVPAGGTPVTATVVVGDTADLLAAEFEVDGTGHGEDAHPSPAWRRWPFWVGATVTGLVLGSLLAHRRRQRLPHTGGAA